MKKYVALCIFALVLCFFAYMFANQVVEASTKRYSTVLFLVDDLDSEVFNQMLNAGKLPNIKKYIIDGGTHFAQSFVVDSQCCPSRASFLTGMYSHNHQVRSVTGSEGGAAQFFQVGDSQKSLNRALKDNGFETAYIGKFLSSGRSPHLVVRQPYWDVWQNVEGYDQRPLKWDVYTTSMGIGDAPLHPRIYQTKYVGDKAIEFINQAKNDYFALVAPRSVHVSIEEPKWQETTNSFLSRLQRETNTTHPELTGWHQFVKKSNGQEVQRQQAILKGRNGQYYFFDRDFINGKWSSWKYVNDLDAIAPNSGNDPVIGWNTMSQSGGLIRQHIIRGNYFYIRDIINGKLGSWKRDSVTVDERLRGTEPGKLVAWAAIETVNNEIIQWAVKQVDSGEYRSYMRTRMPNLGWSEWVDESADWDRGTNDGDVVGSAIVYDETKYNQGQLILRRQLFRKNPYNNDVSAYIDDETLYLGSTADAAINQVKDAPRNEDDMFSAQFLEKVRVNEVDNTVEQQLPKNDSFETSEMVLGMQSKQNTPDPRYGGDNSYFFGRAHADGNWFLWQPSQSYSSNLYPHRQMPAGSLRVNHQKNAYQPKYSSLELGGLYGPEPICGEKPDWVCEEWYDLQDEYYRGMTAGDYLRRFNLDRMEQMITVDVMVGQVAHAAINKGKPVVFIFTSDNGHINGQHNLSNKLVPYEESIRVPLYIKVHGENKSAVISKPVLNIDIPSTILEYAGINEDNHDYFNPDGRSLKPFVDGINQDWREAFLVERRFPRNFTINSSNDWAWGLPDYHAVRTLGQGENSLYSKYSSSFKDAGHLFYEYYNMNSDPQQINNLLNPDTGNASNSKDVSRVNNAKKALDALVNCKKDSCNIKLNGTFISDNSNQAKTSTSSTISPINALKKYSLKGLFQRLQGLQNVKIIKID